LQQAHADLLASKKALIDKQSSVSSNGWLTASLNTTRSGTNDSVGNAVLTCSIRPRWSSNAARLPPSRAASWDRSMEGCTADGGLLKHHRKLKN
jgi:hypothetical protein